MGRFPNYAVHGFCDESLIRQLSVFHINLSFYTKQVIRVLIAQDTNIAV
jgi:hypothetical protein